MSSEDTGEVRIVAEIPSDANLQKLSILKDNLSSQLLPIPSQSSRESPNSSVSEDQNSTGLNPPGVLPRTEQRDFANEPREAVLPSENNAISDKDACAIFWEQKSVLTCGKCVMIYEKH